LVFVKNFGKWGW